MDLTLVYNWCVSCKRIFGCMDSLRENDDKLLECRFCCFDDCVLRDKLIPKEEHNSHPNLSGGACIACLRKVIKKVDKKRSRPRKGGVMKKLAILLALLIFTVAGTVQAKEYTFDGKVSPFVIEKEWKFIKAVWLGGQFFEWEYVNPDESSRMALGLLLVQIKPDEQAISGYAYLENNEPYVFLLNGTTDNYDQMTFVDSNHRNSFRQRMLRILDGKIAKEFPDE